MAPHTLQFASTAAGDGFGGTAGRGRSATEPAYSTCITRPEPALRREDESFRQVLHRFGGWENPFLW
jgi:hypothetical protein